MTKKAQHTLYHSTEFGRIYHGDALSVMNAMEAGSLDLVMTSPPFALTRKKDYGNEQEDAYLEWFKDFAKGFSRVLKEDGSLVIDLGGAWKPGLPVRSLYHFKLLIMLCEEFGFQLCQEFYWWNPSKLPTPAEWVNVRRIRVKDAVNTVWWLSKSPWPKASNRRVLQPYSDSMRHLLSNGYKAKLRPSGHDISDKFSIDNGASIPPNLIAVPNTESNSAYMRYCKVKGIKAHPARFPAALPEYFIRMLTDAGDAVFDPFGGSCITGEVAERLKRHWVCAELIEDYLTGAMGRFTRPVEQNGTEKPRSQRETDNYYRLPHPGLMWNSSTGAPLPEDGGRSRPQKKKSSTKPEKGERQSREKSSTQTATRGPSS
ncbi:MAG: site-specific DNA-methyltransferase [Alphaproteobacteria bacterium]